MESEKKKSNNRHIRQSEYSEAYMIIYYMAKLILNAENQKNIRKIYTDVLLGPL
jgi:hypothetical protein